LVKNESKGLVIISSHQRRGRLVSDFFTARL
jgi:hypothetical protein